MLAILIVLLSAGTAFAQSGTSLGLGTAYSSLARGTEAIFWNPANLAFREEGTPNFTCTLFSLSMNLANNAFNMDDYENYFTDETKYLNDADKQDIIGKIPDDGWEFDMRVNLSALAFTYRNFGFSVSSDAFVELTAPKDFVDVAFTGISHRTYDFSASGNAENVVRANASYARVVMRDRTLSFPVLQRKIILSEIAIGGTFSYNMGIAAFQTQQADFFTIINDNGLKAIGNFVGKGARLKREYDPESDEYNTEFSGDKPIVGKGFGLNIATSMKTGQNYVISLVLKNIVNRTNWTESVLQVTRTLDTGDEKFITGADGLESLDSDDITTEDDHEINSFTTTRPFGFRFGVGKDAGRLKYASELGWEDEKFVAAFGGGLHWAVFNLFAGYSYKYGHNFSGGIGLGGDHLMFDFGIGSQDGITPGSTRGILFASSLRFGW